jgi:hypothetical protein
MNIAFSNLAANVGVSFENIILLVFIFGGCIFYAKDFKLGLVIQFLGAGLLFMWFKTAGLNYTPSLVIFFITLVLLAFSIIFVAKTGEHGGNVI